MRFVLKTPHQTLTLQEPQRTQAQNEAHFSHRAASAATLHESEWPPQRGWSRALDLSEELLDVPVKCLLHSIIYEYDPQISQILYTIVMLRWWVTNVGLET